MLIIFVMNYADYLWCKYARDTVLRLGIGYPLGAENFVESRPIKVSDRSGVPEGAQLCLRVRSDKFTYANKFGPLKAASKQLLPLG
jgi:hypothetical protein